MTLGDLIDTLAAITPQDAKVRMDFGNLPTRLCSWRGIYAELTLDSEPAEGRYGNRPVEARTVAELLADARAADGGWFHGYKGGDFQMSRHTPVYADEWGDYTKRIIAGVSVADGEVVINTYVIPPEYS